MQSHSEDQISVPLILKLALLPMVSPALLILWLPADVRAELTTVTVAMMVLLSLIAVWLLWKLRKPLLAFDHSHVEFQTQSYLARRVRLRLDDIRAVEEKPLQVGFGLRGAQAHAGGAREFRFRLRSGSTHSLRMGITPDFVQRTRELIRRHLQGRDINLALGDEASDDAVIDDRNAHSMLDYAVLFALLGGFMLFTVEYFFLAEEYYAGGAPWTLILGCTLIASALTTFALRSHAESSEDRAKIALVAVATFGFLAYALLPRINLWTDGGGLFTFEYTLGADRVWRAQDETLPTFAFGDRGEFWESFEPGDRREFDLRNGGLGFWQINMKRIYDDQRAYYDEHR